MKKTYHNPSLQAICITTERLISYSGGDSQNKVNVSTNCDNSSDDNRVKQNNYNFWDDNWDK